MRPNSKKMHVFDLDGTLWNIETKVWILDKETPHKPIIRLNNYEISKIVSGLYKSDGLKIEYNGSEYYISKELFNKINKKKKISIERIGLSWIEFYDENYINNTKTVFLFKNINHLRNRGEYITLLSGRSNRDRHANILNELRKKLMDIGIEIYKLYFVSDKFYYKHDETISLAKVHRLLEHMVGLKIEDGKFISFKQDWFNDVYFYDDEKKNIDYANDIQTIFNRLMLKTDDDLFKLIIERITDNEIFLTNNLVSNNEINLFETTKVKLMKPDKYPIKIESEYVKNFNKFIDGTKKGVR